MEREDILKLFKIGVDDNDFSISNRIRRRNKYSHICVGVNGEYYYLCNVSFLKWEMRFQLVDPRISNRVRLREFSTKEREEYGVSAMGLMSHIRYRWNKKEFADNLAEFLSMFKGVNLPDPFPTVVNGFPAVSSGDVTFTLKHFKEGYEKFGLQRVVTGGNRQFRHGRIRVKSGGMDVRKSYAVVADEVCLGYNGWMMTSVNEVVNKIVANIGQFADPFAKRKEGKEGDEHWFLDLKEGGERDQRRKKVFR